MKKYTGALAIAMNTDGDARTIAIALQKLGNYLFFVPDKDELEVVVQPFEPAEPLNHAIKLAQLLGPARCPAKGQPLAWHIKTDENRLIISSETSFEGETVAKIVQYLIRAFEIEPMICFSVATTREPVDGITMSGGEGWMVTKDTIKSESTDEWILAQILAA